VAWVTSGDGRVRQGRPSIHARRMIGVLAAMCLSAAWFAAPAQAASPAYLTISFGRSQWVTTDNRCASLPGAVPLDQVASDMGTRGLTGTGTVILDRTKETGFTCVGSYYLSPGWDSLAWLRDTYGWSVISHSKSYTDMTTLSPQQQSAESCGTIPTFQDHGFPRAWGMFAYPNDRYTTQIQTDVISKCFAFGRRYGSQIDSSSTVAAPWFADVDSVNGGSCNRSGSPCYRVKGAVRRYRSPASLAARVNLTSGQWYDLQFYRFVSGSRGSPSGTGQWRWDCTASDWRLHWTSRTEVYCYGDFLRVLDAVPSSVTVTDPATVATAWGRTPPFS
jgi:hypothetical protein